MKPYKVRCIHSSMYIAKGEVLTVVTEYLGALDQKCYYFKEEKPRGYDAKDFEVLGCPCKVQFCLRHR